MIREIAGHNNHTVKLARKLQKKKYRRERGLFVCEGLDLLRAAVESKAEIVDVLVRRDLLSEMPAGVVESAEAGLLDIGICDASTLSHASSLGGASDVIFSCRRPGSSLTEIDLDNEVVTYLDAVGDPGNVGTLARGCAAFGGGGLVCSPRTADPFGPKAMRAGMGAQFLVPVITEVTQEDLKAKLQSMLSRGARSPEVVVADPHNGEDVRNVLADKGVLLVLGAERCGPSEEWEGCRRVTIPQALFDSLNVAMAGTILLYELSRGRRDKQGPDRLDLSATKEESSQDSLPS